MKTKTREELKKLKDLYLQEMDELHCQFYEISEFEADKKILVVKEIDELTDQFIKDIVESLLPSDEEIENKKIEAPEIGYVYFAEGIEYLKQHILNKLK